MEYKKESIEFLENLKTQIEFYTTGSFERFDSVRLSIEKEIKALNPVEE